MIDSHCHICFLPMEDQQSYIDKASKRGFTQHLIVGYSLADASTLIRLKQNNPGQVMTSMGIHPWVLADHCKKSDARPIASGLSEPDKPIENLQLSQTSKTSLAPTATWWAYKKMASHFDFVGETGLDFAKAKTSEERAVQKTVFVYHLDLACALKRPLVLHVVRAHSEALQMLTQHDQSGDTRSINISPHASVARRPRWRGLVHGFYGDLATATAYSELGFKISIGEAVFKRSRPSWMSFLKSIPLNYVLFESDWPHRRQSVTQNDTASHARFEGFQIIEKAMRTFAEIRGISLEDLRIQVEKNFYELTQQ